MSTGNNALVPRTGPAPRLSEGPRTGQQSLYNQHVLDEDTYTEALSSIITRDFFPDLPHLHATNSYLTALTNNDPELLSSSIRRLAAIAQEKEGRSTFDEARQRELENVGTPYMSVPGGRSRPLRTPVGARGWDTPVMRAGEGSTSRRPGENELEELGSDVERGSAPRPTKKRMTLKKRVRDDLPLDAFQANYTSEDNASFVQIVDEENRRRQEERWGWAWEAERKAEGRRLEGEERRKMILEAATSGSWRVNGEGRRLIGGLAEGGKETEDGEVWSEQKLLNPPTPIAADPVLDHSTKAMVMRSADVVSPDTPLAEQALPEDHPLHRALTEAGLPSTALISTDNGSILPQQDTVGVSGHRNGFTSTKTTDGQHSVMGDEEQRSLSLGGSGADQWAYKTMNNLMFPADSNTKPYPKKGSKPAVQESRQLPKAIRHANTRLPEDDDGQDIKQAGSSRRGSSPARSWVEAAVKGTPYRPGGGSSGPSINDYPLLSHDASPSPADMPSLLTWGTLLATPRALDGKTDPLDTSTPSFRMPDSKRRDEIGRKLGDKASRSMNDRAKGYTPKPNALKVLADKTRRSGRADQTTGTMMPPTATPKRDGLTPAGKRLLERSMGLGVGVKNRGAAMEQSSAWGGGKNSLSHMTWTPSPGRRK